MTDWEAIMESVPCVPGDNVIIGTHIRKSFSIKVGDHDSSRTHIKLS